MWGKIIFQRFLMMLRLVLFVVVLSLISATRSRHKKPRLLNDRPPTATSSLLVLDGNLRCHIASLLEYHDFINAIQVSPFAHCHNDSETVSTVLLNTFSPSIVLSEAISLGVTSSHILDRVILKGGDVNGTFGSALMIAVQLNQARVVRYLLKKNAYIRARNGEVLQLASFHGNKNIVDLLLRRGANVAAQNYGAVIVACFYRRNDIIKSLLRYVHDGSIASRCLEISAYVGNSEMVKYLTKKGADVNWNAGAPLKYAVSRNNSRIMNILLHSGADSNIDGSRVLYEASEIGNTMLVQKLINSGADVNSQGARDSVTIAATKGHVSILKFLKERGVPEEVFQNNELLVSAVQNRRYEVVKFLLEHNSYNFVSDNFRAFIEASKKSSYRIFSLLYDALYQSSASDQLKRVVVHRAFFWASIWERFNILYFLSSRHYAFNRTIATEQVRLQGHSALIAASRSGSRHAVDQLLSYNIIGNFAIHLAFLSAACEGHINILRIFLSRPSTNIHHDDDAALLCAVRNGHTETVDFLLQKGSNIHAQSDLAFIESTKNRLGSGLAWLLLQHGADATAQHGRALITAVSSRTMETVVLVLNELDERKALSQEVLNEALRAAMESRWDEACVELIKYGAKGGLEESLPSSPMIQW